jgi:DNA-binding transcriptional MerR regulator
LTLRDIEVLRSVKALRDQGLQTEAINQQLAQLTFAVVETSFTEAPSDARELRVSDLAPIQAIVQALQPFEARIAKLEARRFDVQSFAIGVIVAGIFFALMLLLAVLYSR